MTARCTLFALCAASLSAQAGPVLRLDDAEAAAKLHQPALLQARAASEAAEARVGESRAGLLPQVTANVGYQRTTGNYVPKGGTISSGSTTVTTSANANNSTATFNAFSDSLVANQLIWDFDQTYGKYSAAKALSESAIASERASLLTIVLNVRSYYFAARANKALAEVSRQTVANDQKHLDQIQGFVQAGTRSQIDLVQAKTDLANAQLAEVNAENTYETSKQALLLAMGSPGSTDFDVADETLPPVANETSLQLQPLVDEALKARPEMEAFTDQARAQTETIASAKGAYGPTISASAGLSQGGEALDNLAWNGYVGLSLTWAIFQGGLTNSTVREAEANLRSIAAQEEAERQQIASDVNNARLSVRGALASAAASREVLVNAKELLRLAEGQYETGIGSIIQLSDAQVAETLAEAQVIQADFNLAAARALLLKALGRP